MEKILSISIAAYNIEKYICSTIESLINKDVIDKMEILIVSDGSTDNTVKIGKEYEKKYPGSIRVIEKKNGGWGSTVNTGIINAKGKYFKLIDGDDQAMTENLTEFIQYLEAIGVGYIVATDISKDGTLTGPNFEMYDEIAKNSQIQFVVSGGIKDFDNIQKVAQKDYYACIVGKAYYEKKIDLKETIKCLQNV